MAHAGIGRAVGPGTALALLLSLPSAKPNIVFILADDLGLGDTQSMNTEVVQTLTTTFEAHAQQTNDGVEYWLARDLQQLLGYEEWRNFNTAVSKAKTACEISGQRIADHFVGVNKMVDLGSGSQREVDDTFLLQTWEASKK